MNSTDSNIDYCMKQIMNCGLSSSDSARVAIFFNWNEEQAVAFVNSFEDKLNINWQEFLQELHDLRS